MRRLPRGTMANSKTIATMKRLFNIMMFVAVAAMGITACQNEPTEINVSAKKVTIEVIGELDATRSSFGDFVENGDADYYPSKWDGGEQVVFSLNEAALVTAENTGTGSNATFSVGLTDDETTEGTIYAFSPKGNYSTGKGGFTSINASYQDLYVVVPTEQTPSTTSVDPAAHLLAGKATYDNGLPSSIKMTFNHVAAYGRMEITNFAEEITKVKITASAPLAGTSCFYYYAGEKMGQLTNADQTTITINNPAADNKVFWFGCAPADLSEGTLEVKVYTADASYTKSIDFASKDLELGFAFVQGQVANFRVSITAANKDEALTIEDGQYVVAGKVGDVYYAMYGANQTTAATIASKEITVTDGKVAAADAAGYVWTVAAAEGGYTFFNGEHYLLASSSSGTSLKTQAEPVVWALGETGDNGYIFISPKADNRYLMFNGDNSTNKFGAYAQTNYANENYSGIYLLPIDGVIKTRLAKPALTATVQNANEIVVSWGAVTGAKDYTVTFNNGEPETVTSTEKTYTELAYSTEYTITVVANPENEEQYIASEAASATVTTEADPNAEAPTSGYKLITSMSDLTDGEYIIAGYMGSKYYAMPNNVTSGKISSSEITVVSDYVTSSTTNLVWTITKSGNYYTIFDGTKYIYHSNGGNSGTDLAKGTTSLYPWSISYDTSGFKLACVNGTTIKTRGMLMNNNYQFGGYALSNYGNSSYSGIYLFKKIGDIGGGDEPTPVQLTAPTNLSATKTTNSVTISWTAVANASSYDVTVGTTTKNVTATTATFDGLTPDTTYNVSVVAVGDGTNYTDSTAATTTVKTLAESSGGDVATTTATITFSDLGYTVTTNMWELSPAAIEIDANTSVTFFKGTNANGCKYYTNGSAVRCYGGAYFTVSSTTKTIVKIELVYGDDDGSNAITTDCGTFVSPTWTGSSNSVKFTIGGTTGHRRIARVQVTYEN